MTLRHFAESVGGIKRHTGITINFPFVKNQEFELYFYLTTMTLYRDFLNNTIVNFEYISTQALKRSVGTFE